MTALWAWLDDEGGRFPGLAARMAGECARLAEEAGVRPCGVVISHAAAGACTASDMANGLDLVYALTSEPAPSAAEVAACLVAAIRSKQPLGVLLPATATGSDIAARTAAALEGDLLADCVDLEWREGGLQARREVHDRCAHLALGPAAPPPWIVTLNPAVAHANDFPKRAPAIEALGIAAADPGDTAPVETWRLAARELDVMEADVVLAVGKGVDAGNTLGTVFEVAALLDAAVGGSREAVFAGMVPRERQIGASGKWIAPKVYVALGISGSSYHLMGIRDAQHVAAVNLDAGAPMLERAEWTAVADVDQVVPAMRRILAGEGG